MKRPTWLLVIVFLLAGCCPIRKSTNIIKIWYELPVPRASTHVPITEK